jgi:hypothetical protein
VVVLSSQSIFLSDLVLGGDNSITTESRPWNPPVVYCGLPGLFFFKAQSYLHQLERSRSFAVIYASSRCVCDDKAPDHAWLHAISKLIPRTGRANPQDWQLRWYAHEAGNLSAAMETDSGQRLSPEGIAKPDGSLFLRVTRLTFDLPRWAHGGGRTGGLWDRDNFPC